MQIQRKKKEWANEWMASETENAHAHTNVIILNGNRLDNNGSKVKQIIVLLTLGHKAHGEQRIHKLCKLRIGRAYLFNSNDDRTCAKTLCKNLFITTTTKNGFFFVFFYCFSSAEPCIFYFSKMYAKMSTKLFENWDVCCFVSHKFTLYKKHEQE